MGRWGGGGGGGGEVEERVERWGGGEEESGGIAGAGRDFFCSHNILLLLLSLFLHPSPPLPLLSLPPICGWTYLFLNRFASNPANVLAHCADVYPDIARITKITSNLIM